MVYSFRGIEPKIHPTAFLTPSADVVGDVEIGANCSLWFNVTVRGDVHSIKIDDDTNVQDGSVLHVTYQQSALTIGKGVTIGHAVTLHGCTVKDYVLVGMRAVILDDAIIGEESLVGAGALVTQGMVVPPRSLVLGSPAKVVRQLKPEEIEFLHKSPENYKQYVAWYREGKFREAAHRE